MTKEELHRNETTREQLERAGKTAVEKAMHGGKQVVDMSKKGGQKVVDMSKKSGQKVVDISKKSGQKVVDISKKGGQQVVAVGKQSARKAQEWDEKLDDACAYSCGPDGCCGPRCDAGCVRCCPCVERIVTCCDGLASAEEGGCKVPCYDETDNGVPPFFAFPWCPFDHRHYLNTSPRMRRWGEVGYPYFGRTRRLWMGIATISTLMSMVATGYGLSALSTEEDTVMNARWAWSRGHNAGGEFLTVFVGLRSMVFEYCDADGRNCDLESIVYGEHECDNAYCDRCVPAAVGVQIGAFITWFTHIFALLGCMNRMRYSSDCPFQKLLGATTDTWGALSLLYTIVSFRASCYVDLMNVDEIEGYSVYRRHLGYGVFTYMCCILASFLRAFLMWITPCPTEWHREKRRLQWAESAGEGEEDEEEEGAENPAEAEAEAEGDVETAQGSSEADEGQA